MNLSLSSASLLVRWLISRLAQASCRDSHRHAALVLGKNSFIVLMWKDAQSIQQPRQAAPPTSTVTPSI